MKIPNLLAQYLYSHQRLDLPGIGTFLLDQSSLSALENSKQRSAILEGVTFQSDPGLRDTPDLIAFIARKTGKMKALAASDLQSHLQLSEEFLNIGKPFAFEGIGIISKGKKGEIEFTPITVSTDKVKECQRKEPEEPSSLEASAGKYETFLSSPARPVVEWKRPLVGFLLFCGVAGTIWGGYIISKNANRKRQDNLTESVTVAAVPDTIQPATIDTARDLATTAPAEQNYKYVLEVAKPKRAFKRFNQLKSIRWKVQLETRDSLQYTLFMLLPAVSDTTRTIDSLTVMSGRKVYIEYPNQPEGKHASL